MDDKKWIIKYNEYKKLNELPSDYKALLDKATKATKKAYSPYSKFRVGAALILTSGRVFTGSNFENAAYPLCLCAERVALAAAHAESPEEIIECIAITAKNPSKPLSQPVPPCGACRQVLCEVEQKQDHPIQIILRGESGPVQVFKNATSLLPSYFNASFLKS